MDDYSFYNVDLPCLIITDRLTVICVLVVFELHDFVQKKVIKIRNFKLVVMMITIIAHCVTLMHTFKLYIYSFFIDFFDDSHI